MATEHVSVTVRDGNIEKALSIFKKKVMNSGHLLLYKEKQEFVKPSVKKREKLKKAKYSQYISDLRKENY
jgi:small subunit ribosomal protein S21